MMGFGESPDSVTDIDPKARLAALVAGAVRTAFPGAGEVTIDFDRPKSADHGDFATNVALQLAKRVGMKPRDAAQAIVAALEGAPEIAKTEVAGPGFINFTLSKASRFAVVGAIQAAAGELRARARRRDEDHHGGVRLGQSHRAASRRPRAPGRAGRCHLHAPRVAALEGASGVLLQRRRQPDREPGAVGPVPHPRGEGPRGEHRDARGLVPRRLHRRHRPRLRGRVPSRTRSATTSMPFAPSRSPTCAASRTRTCAPSA